MALITNNISGSSSDASKIGITGSVIISNRGDANFPSLGSDAVFFVSGSESSKSVFGGAAKISGSLATDGNVTLGNSSDDVISVTGATTFNGNVGISTAPGTTTLFVSGSSTASTLTAYIKGGAPNQTGPILEVDNNLGTALLLVSGSGNIAVGTTSLSSAVTVSGGSSVLITGGTSGNVVLNNTATTNTITLGGTSQTGTITIGQSTSSNQISIGQGLIDNGATQTVSIATNSTGTARSLISIGSDNHTGAMTLRAGTGNITLTAGSTGGNIIVGNSTVSNTISIASGTTAASATQTVNIATAATSTGKALVSIGNTNGASGLTLSCGTGNMSLNPGATGTINIGTSDSVGTITLGQTTDTNTINIGNAITASGKTQTIAIGNSTASGGTLNINIGASTAGTNTITIGKFGSNLVNVILGGDAIKIGDNAGTDVGFFNTTPVAKQSVTDITNSIASGGTSNTLTNYTNLSTYSSDAAAIRGNFHQIGLKLNAIIDALQAYGLF